MGYAINPFLLILNQVFYFVQLVILMKMSTNNQSVRYVHSYLERVILIPTSTNNPSQKSEVLESAVKPSQDCKFVLTSLLQPRIYGQGQDNISNMSFTLSFTLPLQAILHPESVLLEWSAKPSQFSSPGLVWQKIPTWVLTMKISNRLVELTKRLPLGVQGVKV